MQLLWKEFNIHLPSLSEFLLTLPEGTTDGIVCTTEYLVIVETANTSQSEIDAVNEYYDALTEDGELLKFNRPYLLTNAIHSLKEGMLSKRYSELNIIERKLLLGVALTTEEEDSIL